MFCLQACQGAAQDRGVFVETDNNGQPEPDSFSEYLHIPPHIAVMFTCSPGYGAFLNAAGSMFLQALPEVMAGEERCLALSCLATCLNAAIALGCQACSAYEGCKQMSCFITNVLWDILPFSAAGEPLPSIDT